MAAAVVVAGVFFNLSSIAGRRPTAVIDQVKLVATPTGAGTWAIVVKNTGDVPITSITATFPGGCDPGTLSFAPDTVNPGGTAAGTGDADDCTLGTSYPVVITVNFQDGSRQILLTQATASLA
ncbi:hypothetical protein HRbin01_01243 [archaeon HR01]|nr:hypothetical protein HRbin01_01243 [archaeon HR01]